jgi:glycosyltransferase involved in cell wall biosynthesis
LCRYRRHSTHRSHRRHRAINDSCAAGLHFSQRWHNIWREIAADHAGFVEPDDLAGTTRLIERWLHTPPEEQNLMRLNARNCFLRRFEINRAAASLLAILQAQ